MDYKPASVSPRIVGEIERLQNQIRHDTGRNIVLLACEQPSPEAKSTPIFGDLQAHGPSSIKERTFGRSATSQYDGIAQWHI